MMQYGSDMSIVKLLAHLGADASKPNKQGKTAFTAFILAAERAPALQLVRPIADISTSEGAYYIYRI